MLISNAIEDEQNIQHTSYFTFREVDLKKLNKNNLNTAATFIIIYSQKVPFYLHSMILQLLVKEILDLR